MSLLRLPEPMMLSSPTRSRERVREATLLSSYLEEGLLFTIIELMDKKVSLLYRMASPLPLHIVNHPKYQLRGTAVSIVLLE